jgi:hypothetical protein
MYMTAEQALMCYADAFYRVHRFMPDDLLALDDDWVFVNGVRIHVSEVNWLTNCLEQEFAMQQQKRGVVVRLIEYFEQ